MPWLLGVILLTGVGGCDPKDAITSDDGAPDEPLHDPIPGYEVPEDIGDGLGSGHALDQGMDARILGQMVREIREDRWPMIHSVLIHRRGHLLLEEYRAGRMGYPDDEGPGGDIYEWDRDLRHPINSITKSITGAALGIAIDDGAIPGVDEPIRGYFPEMLEYGGTLASGELRIRHLLTMSAGLEWREIGYYGTEDNYNRQKMTWEDGPLHFVFSRPLVAPPGETWLYNSGLTDAVGEIVARAVGEPFDEYMDRKLLGPLGITHYLWRSRMTNEVVQAGGGLLLRPRDTMKFGVLYLNGGVWQGRRILPESWIDESLRARHPLECCPYVGYGYFWWRGDWNIGDRQFSAPIAIGYRGQFIWLFRDLELVVVMNSGQDITDAEALLEHFILPAVQE